MRIRDVLLAVAFGFGVATAAEAAPQPEGAVDMAEVLKAAPLPELAMGPENGIPVIEYGSVTCPHCAAFDKTVLPKFKAAYVDTGKVRYIFREFSRNALDVAAFTLIVSQLLQQTDVAAHAEQEGSATAHHLAAQFVTHKPGIGDEQRSRRQVRHHVQ